MSMPCCATAPCSTGGSRAPRRTRSRRRAQPRHCRAAADRQLAAGGGRRELRWRPLPPGAAVAGRNSGSRAVSPAARLTHPEMPRAVACDLPDWLEPHLAAVYGRRLEDEMAALNAPAPLDLRVNPLKADRDDRPPRARRRAYRRRADAVVAARPAPQAPGAARRHRRVQGRARRGAGRRLATRRPARRCAPRHAGRRFLRRRRRQDAGARRPDAQPRQARRLRRRRRGGSSAPARGCAAPASAMSSAARCPPSATPGSSITQEQLRPRLCRRAVSRHRQLAAQPRRQMARAAARTSPNSSRASATSWPAPRVSSDPAAASSTRPARCCARKTRRRPKPFSPPHPDFSLLPGGARLGGDDRRRFAGRRRLSPPDPGPPRHRRVFRRDL